jgi:hypothetical protein
VLKEVDVYSSVTLSMKKKPNCIELFVEARKQGINSAEVFGAFHIDEKTKNKPASNTLSYSITVIHATQPLKQSTPLKSEAEQNEQTNPANADLPRRQGNFVAEPDRQRP